MNNREAQRVQAQDKAGKNRNIGDITTELIAQDPSLGTGEQKVVIEGVFFDGTSQVRELTIQDGEWTELSADLNLHPR
jgi:Zn/Cd-binding protein ZinT